MNVLIYTDLAFLEFNEIKSKLYDIQCIQQENASFFRPPLYLCVLHIEDSILHGILYINALICWKLEIEWTFKNFQVKFDFYSWNL